MSVCIIEGVGQSGHGVQVTEGRAGPALERVPAFPPGTGHAVFAETTAVGQRGVPRIEFHNCHCHHLTQNESTWLA